MIKQFLQSISLKTTLIITLFFAFYSSSTKDAYAIYSGVRKEISWVNKVDNMDTDRPWKGLSYQCSSKSLKYNPFQNTSTDSETKKDGYLDLDWEISNPVCISYMVGAALTTLIAGKVAGKLCKVYSAQDKLIETAHAAGIGLSPAIIKKLATKSATCTTYIKACVSSAGAAGCSDAGTCCAAVGLYAAAQGAAFAALAILWKTAEDSKTYARVCGRHWNTWEYNDKTGIWEKSGGKWIGSSSFSYNEYSGSYSKYLSDKSKLGKIKFDIKNREYRELIYGGIEYEDNGSKSCDNPKWDEKTLTKVLGYTSTKQRYYTRGPNETINYSCDRFLIYDNEENRVAGKIAFNCCADRSQNAMCIESSNSIVKGSGYDYSFCEGGTKCAVKGVTYQIYSSTTNEDTLCSKTYSVCPYNHPMGGGTEEADPNKKTDIKNFCQFMKHCIKVPAKPYIRTTNMSGGYISSSCYDLVGDSQNTYPYINKTLSINTRNFSAPMAQCFHETMANIFLHQAGHVECNDPEEILDKSGKCKSGMKQNIGDKLSGPSFFEKVQYNLRLVIKLILTASIMTIGFSILVGGSFLARKDLSMYIIKVALIMYFALGTAWQTFFFNGLYESSVFLSSFVTRINEGNAVRISTINTGKNQPADTLLKITVSNPKDITEGDLITLKDLYEIPEINGKKFTITNISDTSFNLKDNKEQLVKTANFGEYLSKSASVAFDKKLDGCQFPRFDYNDPDPETRYLNPRYPPGKEYLKIWDTLDCKIVRSLGYAPGLSVPQIFMLILSALFTGGAGIVFMFSTMIFVFCLVSITLRALHMFVLSSTAIVIFIYISPLMITAALFKKTENMFKSWWSNLLGFTLQPLLLFAFLGILITIFDSTIAGNVDYTGDGNNAPKIIQCNSPEGKQSVYCIFSELGIKTNNVSALGIGLPSLEVLNPTSGRLKEIVFIMVKAAFLLFIFMQFFEKMSKFSSEIFGGGLSPTSIDIGKTMGKGYAALRGIQQRGARGLTKAASAGVKMAAKGADNVRSAAQTVGSAGRAVGNKSKPSSGDSASAEAKRPGGSTNSNNDK